ncbi:SirB2 family protein [Otariodibacter sp.]|uniref:SirB2 family protein n=1 Tax=Otariodibacter sp. TaxID=3030919 RepID=UPI002620DDDD|nr:SirB2 family protein [Otariodibacter sp.]
MQILFFSHITFAYISLILLLIRGILSIKNVNWRQYKVLRILPHFIDSLLLISGVSIFVIYGFSIFEIWIWLKILFIILYIIFSIKTFGKNKLFSIKYLILSIISFISAMIIVIVK